MHDKLIEFRKLPPIPKRKETLTPMVVTNRLVFRNIEQEYELKKRDEKTIEAHQEGKRSKYISRKYIDYSKQVNSAIMRNKEARQRLQDSIGKLN